MPSRAPCSRPGFTLPGRTKQTQPQPCSSVRGLGWHSRHTTISRWRQRLAFCSGTQADSRTRPVPSPQERRGHRIPAHGLCTGMGSCRGQSPLLPRNPVPPRTLPHPGGRRHLTARSFRELFLRVQGRRLVANPCLHLGQAKELLSPWAQRLRTCLLSAQTPFSEWSTRPCSSCPLGSP